MEKREVLIRAIFRTKGFEKYVEKIDEAGKKTVTTTTRISQAGANVRKTVTQFVKDGRTMSRTTLEITKRYSDFVKALRRVAIVVPIWYFFRQAFMMVINTIRDGARYFVELDKAIMKAKAVIHEAGMSMTQSVKILREELEKLSTKTGESMDSLASAFYRFGTVGISFSDSLAGMNTSLKVAMAMMGDVDSIARTLSLTYKLLGDTIDKSIEPHLRLESVGAKLYKLWRINAFEINEFIGALQNFLPTADTLNMSLDETLALLATLQSAGLKGARAGRLLRTSLDKLLVNLNELAGALRLGFDPQTESSFELFMRVLDRLEQMAKGQTIPAEAITAMSKIFGGVRGGLPIKALISMNKLLKENLDIVKASGGDFTKMMEEFNNRVEDVNTSVHRQVQIFKELKRQVGMNFIIGLTGADDFAQALEKINSLMYRLSKYSRVVGDIFNIGKYPRAFVDIASFPAKLLLGVKEEAKKVSMDLGEAIFGESETYINNFVRDLNTALEGKLGLEATKNILDKLSTPLISGKLGEAGINVEKTKQILGNLIKQAEELKDINVAVEKLNSETKHRLELMSKELNYLEMQSRGYSNIEIATQKLYDYVSNLVSKWNELDFGENVEKLNEQDIIMLALQGKWEEILKLSKNQVITNKEIEEIAKRINDIHKERINLVNKYASSLREAFKGDIKKMLSGEGFSLEGFFSRYREMQLEAMSERITKELEKTGIFNIMGEGLAQVEDPIIKAGRVNADLWYSSIVRAGQEVASALQGSISGGAGVVAPQTQLPQIPTTGAMTTANITAYTGQKIPTRQPTFFNNLLNLGIAGYSGYRSGGIGGAISSIASTLFLFSGHPFLALGAMLLGGLFRKKKTITESTWTPQEVKEMFPKFNIDIAPLPKLYALPSSRYFGGAGLKMNVNLNINIDKIEGTDKVIVDQIGSTVRDEVIKVVNVRFVRELIRGNVQNEVI